MKPGTSGAEPLVPGARYAIAPAGVVATAWPRVANTCRNIGWRFDPWQDAVGRLILAKNAEGGWAADLSILSIPRQTGKSFLLGCVIFGMCLLNPRLRVIWTSHHTATTEEMYEAMKELAAHKRVAPHVIKCVALQGSRWRIVFRNGSRVDFGARSQGFGRGKAKVGVLVLDEFQHITSRALANLAPTTNTATNPLILCAGTPPGPEASGEAFTMRRKAALEGISDDTLYVEFSADRGADSGDRHQWAKANPSFPKRTKERAFLLLRKILDEDDFGREALGIWDEFTRHQAVVGKAAWAAMTDVGPVDGTRPDALAVDMSHERHISIAGAWREGDCAHVEEVWAGVDEAAAVAWVAEHAGRREVLIDAMSPAASMVPALKARRTRVRQTTAGDMSKACGLFVAACTDPTRLTHAGQEPLDDAVAGARKRPIGKAGGWGWDRKDPSVNIAPLVAATLALLGVESSKRRARPGPHAERRALVLT